MDTVCANSPTYAQFHFYKHSPKNSGVYLRQFKRQDNPPNSDPQTGESYVRGGSGTSDDTCDNMNGGWLPSGWYNLQQHLNHKNDLIKGRTWWMSDKRCWDGVTWRNELFVHTEETAAGGQSSGDERYRWDGTGDYYSLGCIKVSHDDTDVIHGLWADWDGRHNGFSHAYGVRVYN